MLTLAVLAAFFALVWVVGSYVAGRSEDHELQATRLYERHRAQAEAQRVIEDAEERMP